MPQASFGMVLREARERKGLDIQSVSRRLRVRPDILRALEDSDFTSLPARGYTRNMVSAYARLVGLNPSDITDLYLDQMYSHQVKLSRKDADSPAHVSGRRSVANEDSRSRRLRRDGDDAYAEDESRSRRPSSQRRQRGEEASRSSSRERGARGRHPSDSSRNSRGPRPSGRGASSRRGGDRGGLQDTLAVRAAQAEGKSRRIGQSTSMNHLSNLYSGMASVAQHGSSRGPVVIVAVVILILLVIIFALLFGNHGSAQQQDVAKVPVTGVSESSSGNNSSSNSDSSSNTQAQQVKVPTSVKVEYKLASGQQAYVVITQDDTQTEQMLTGPVSETVDVSGTWSLATYVSDAFTITMDGKSVEFETDSATGMPTATVSFEDYLKTWATAHPDVKVDTTSTSNSTNSSTTGATGSSGSSTSTSGSANSSTGSTSGTTSQGSNSASSTTSSSTGSTSTTSTGNSASTTSSTTSRSA